MKNSCVVHGSNSECISSLLAKLKIAVALVVIRNKPSGQSTKDFVHNLVFFHHDKEQQWKAEYHRLKQEVLELRQQQLLLAIDSRFITQTPSHATTGEISRLPDCFEDSLLTPPNSQSLDNEPCTTLALPTAQSRVKDNTDADNMKFLQAYFYLEHQLRLNRPTSSSMSGNVILENDTVRQSVLAVLQHVDSSVTRERCDFSKCLDSLRVCIRLLDRNGKWMPAIRDKFTELSGRWLQRMTQRDNVLRHYALLQTLADSESMGVRLADALVKSIGDTQQRIKEWEWDGIGLISRPLLAHFTIASYYFLLMEKTIPRMAPTDKTRFVAILSHVEAETHVNFPLFAAWMMRLAHRLAC